jgi:hypothetical protein
VGFSPHRSRASPSANRLSAGYDATLATGPYNFGWATTVPDTVEHYAYQDSLGITYWKTAQRKNNTPAPRSRTRPARRCPHQGPQVVRGTVVRNRIQSFDVTSGQQATEPLSLHRRTSTGMTTLTASLQLGVAVSDDTNPNAYYDAANPCGSALVVGPAQN